MRRTGAVTKAADSVLLVIRRLLADACPRFCTLNWQKGLPHHIRLHLLGGPGLRGLRALPCGILRGARSGTLSLSPARATAIPNSALGAIRMLF